MCPYCRSIAVVKRACCEGYRCKNCGKTFDEVDNASVPTGIEKK